MTSLLRRRTLEVFDAQTPPYPVVAHQPFDREAVLADALACARLGLRERALQSVAEVLLSTTERSAELEALVTLLCGEFEPSASSRLLADACAYGTIGLREKGLVCLVQALWAGGASRSRLALAWVLKELWVKAPTEDAMPLIEAELA